MLAYLDHAATTPVKPEAAAVMIPWLTEHWGNPSGSHRVARAARLAVDDARELVANLLGADQGGVIWTGSGTEASNLAIRGRLAEQPGTVVTTAIEHHAVLHTVEHSGAPVRVVPVDPSGVVDLDALGAALDAGVTLVSVQAVNNEVGTVQPLADVARLVRRRAPGAVLHTDAVQAAPWFDLAELTADADMVSISAHKFGGPQGVGALVLRRAVPLQPLIRGGGQERDRRAGTHNVAGISGLATALEATNRDRVGTTSRVVAQRDRLAEGIRAGVPGLTVTASGAARTPGHCHLLIPGVESEALLLVLDEEGVCASAGSACASGAMEPSHVLLAMGAGREEALGALRLSLGWSTTDAEVDHALRVVPRAVARLRGAAFATSAGATPGVRVTA